ncbi:ATP synthase subunit b, mitochondrial [Anabrus simplex]|uniref:ATP synthase subunit b, mitochondrial n=1 Tax=Anabrus simplex TaxID=316456 RepID=UPI0034DCEDE4
MLSRVALSSALTKQGLGKPLLGARWVQTGAASPASSSVPTTQESPERDLVNFPRPVRLEYPAKVRYGFIPETWFEFFYKKTGVTGPYAFGVGLLTFLCSKEIYVMEHEYYTGISLAIMSVVAVKKLGPVLAKFADKQIDDIEHQWKENRESTVRMYEEGIENEKQEQWRAEGQNLLFQAKKDNIGLQLEAVYRERLMEVFGEVKRRLDYQVERQNIERRIAQKHMVAWVLQNVLKSITPQQEKESLQKCILDLKNLAKA